MAVINATDHVCNETNPLCPFHFPLASNISLPPKSEGEQSRFLGLILGMDPLSLLSASNLDLPTIKSTAEVDKYRSAVKMKDAVEMIAFLHVLKIISAEEHVPCFNYEQPIDPSKFKQFAKQIKVEHKKKMSHVLWSTLMPQYYVSNPNAASDAYLKMYLNNNWEQFRKIVLMIMKNGWFFDDTWKAYHRFKGEEEFSDKIIGVASLTQMRQLP